MGNLQRGRNFSDGFCSANRASLVAQLLKHLPAMQETPVIPGLGRSPGEDHLLEHSCLETPMDRGAWQATVHGSQRVRHDWAAFTSRAQKIEAHQYLLSSAPCSILPSFRSHLPPFFSFSSLLSSLSTFPSLPTPDPHPTPSFSPTLFQAGSEMEPEGNNSKERWGRNPQGTFSEEEETCTEP